MLGGVLPTASAGESDQPKQPENIALGRPYTLDPAPNYPHCKDANDPRDLTDGVYGTGPELPGLWALKTSVGWMFATPTITIDLGETRSIDGLSFSTAAGDGGVGFLRQLFLFVSDDGIHWKAVKENLVDLSAAKRGKPPENRPALWRYQVRGLDVSGRYVAIVPAPGCDNPDDKNYVFCDEIKIFGGDKDPQESQGKTLTIPGEGKAAINNYVRQQRIAYSARKRMTHDLEKVQAALKAAPVSDEERQKLQSRLAAAAKQVDAFAVGDLARFEAVLPLAPAHEEIFSIFGRILQAKGLPEVLVWNQHRYLLPPYLEEPPADVAPPRLEVNMMREEFRADSLNITNASAKDRDVILRVKDLPESGDWLRISAVPWTDTLQHQPVADALPWLEKHDNAYRFPLRAGMTQKLWFRVQSSNLPPGEHKGRVEIEWQPGQIQEVPFSVRVSPFALGRPGLAVSLWDYANGQKESYGLTPENMQASIEMMRAHFVNGTWAYGSIFPRPDSKTPGQGFANFDRWVALWPGIENYYIFLNAKEEFDGVKMTDPVFSERVGAWIREIAKQLDARGIERKRLVLQLVDEPHTDQQDAIIEAWAKAVKAAVPEFQILENPTWLHPGQTRNAQAMKLPDIICPFIRQYESGGAVTEEFFKNRPAHQRLSFYQCEGPNRLFDPTNYYRSKAWWVFDQGAEGLHYWAFGNIGGDSGVGASPSNWNEYDTLTPNFSPVFIRPTDVTGSIHLEALREGIEDYQYLNTLRKEIASAPEGAWKQQAQELLQTAPKMVAGKNRSNLAWLAAKPADVTTPDEFRQKILSQLENIKHDQ